VPRTFDCPKYGAPVSYSSDGRYLNVFKTDGYASGMVFNDRNELFVVARTKVIKLAMAQ